MMEHRYGRRNRTGQRGSVIIIAIVSLVVITILALAMMDGANSTFQQGHRQPRLTSLESLADGGVQYGYWQYTYGGQTTLPFTSSKVTVGTPGYFIVTVTDTSGQSNLSNTIQIVSSAYIYNDKYTVTRILAKGGGGSGGSSAPTAPTNLTATADVGSIGLTWNASTGATSYDIYRGTSSNGEGAAPYATSTSASYSDSGATVGTKYYYFVTALNSSGASSDSNEASATETTAGYVTATPSVPSNGNYYAQEQLSITNTQSMTSLTITIVVHKTTGLTYDSEWDNFWSGYLTPTYVDNGSTVTYTFTEPGGDAQSSGSYYVADSYDLTGTAHVTTNDTYTVQVTAGGVSQTLTGHF